MGVGGLLLPPMTTGAGPGVDMLMDETSCPPDTSAATARTMVTPVVMNQHGKCAPRMDAFVGYVLPPPKDTSTSRRIQIALVIYHSSSSLSLLSGGSNWGRIQVRVKKSAAKRLPHDAAALAGLSSALAMNEGKRAT